MKKIGILDPEGKELNPLTGEPYSSSYKYYLEISKWNELPMYTQIKPRSIIKDIMENQVLILESGTGSGKSVLMPKYALHTLDYKGKVVITNPKQLPTRENADWAAKLLDVELGKEVGFQYHNSKLDDGMRSKSMFTKLLFSTDGSVVEVLRKNPTGSDYDIVIIDEAHERNLSIDLLLLQMKRALRLNPKLKLIVMSATLPGNIFYDYFKEFKIKSLSVSGKTNKPVKVHHLKKKIKTSEIMEKTVEILFKEIIEKKKEGDVLIFTETKTNAERIRNKILSTIKEKYPDEKIKCYVITSKVKDPEIRELAIKKDKYREEPGGPWDRKIVIGTNQLESSITVDGIVFVIDNGKALEPKFDFSRMEEQLLPETISRASATQRKGRAGRTRPGECFKLYTAEQEKEMNENTTLLIKKSDISGSVFSYFKQIDVNNVGDMRNFLNQYIEPPPKISMDYSINLFYDLGLITSAEEDGEVSEIGTKVLELIKTVNYNVRLARCLVESIANDCAFEVSAICSILNNIESTDELFSLDKLEKYRSKQFEKKKKFFTHNSGDILSLYKMYEFFYRKIGKFNYGKLRSVCYENFLNFGLLLDIRRDHIDFFRSLRSVKYSNENTVELKDNLEKIIFSIMSGYFTNMSKKIKNGTWKNYYPKKLTSAPLVDFFGRPLSFIDKRNSEFIMYTELIKIKTDTKFVLCTRITKKQISKFNKLYDKNISFEKDKTKEKLDIENIKDVQELIKILRNQRLKKKINRNKIKKNVRRSKPRKKIKRNKK